MKGHGQSTSNLTRNLANAQESAAIVNSASARRFPPEPLSIERADSLPTSFEIHTEDKPGFVRLIARYFESATIIPVTGIWKGQVEGAVIIKLVQPYYERQNVLRLADDILKANKQEAVMVTLQNTRGFDTIMVNA